MKRELFVTIKLFERSKIHNVEWVLGKIAGILSATIENFDHCMTEESVECGCNCWTIKTWGFGYEEMETFIRIINREFDNYSGCDFEFIITNPFSIE